ncbi:hypothetical protein SUDANB121_00353 [Nocardiopsis dassonvillei]|uniref:MFS transporter n=1 Tax=Nocardiopsis dassonvillei TaxID=2014 RepID=UPI003F54BB46
MTDTRRVPAEGLFSRPHAAATTGFAVVMFLTGPAALAVVPTLPTAARDLDGVPLYPLVAGCFVSASLLGGVVGGHWADRAGAHRPLAAGRFLDGLAGGMVAVSVNTAIGQSFPERLRPRALALMSACWVIPSLVGPPLAGVVTELWTWRAVFLGLAGLTLLPALAVAFLLRARPLSGAVRAEDPARRPPLLVAAAVSAGAAAGQYGISGWDARHLAFAAAGIALLAVFAPRLLPPGTWRVVRGLPATVLLCGAGSGAFFTLEALVPLMLVAERDAAPVMIGLLFTGAAVLWAAASWVQGRLLEQVPRHRLVAAGAAVMVAAVAVAVTGALPAVPAPVAGASMLVAAAGMGMLAPSLTVLSLAHSPGRQGYAGSAMQINQNLGQVMVLGAAAAVSSLALVLGAAAPAGYAAAFALLLVPCAGAALLAARTRSA